MPADLQYAIPIKITKEELESAQLQEAKPDVESNCNNKDPDDLDAKFGPGMRIQRRAIRNIESKLLGMTIGFKVDTREVIIEAPLDKDKSFMILNNLMLLADGTLTYTRRMFETISGKKLR